MISLPLRIFRRAALGLGLSALLSPRPVAANPVHPVVTHGSASFSTQGPQFTIRTGGNAMINWTGFNIAAGETTTFIEPSANSVVWNHISDPNPTQILGHIDANGYVVLQNQSGFYVGGNAVINAAGLVMTTTPAVPLNVFGGGSWDFNAPPPTAKIINYGEINTGQGGSAFLISQDIENHGSITAPGGSIGLCAGKEVLLSDRADGRGMSAKVTLPEGSVNNDGKLIADAGTIALNAQVVNQGGLIQANSVRDENGVIEVVASDNITLGDNSTISAKGNTEGVSAGGKVTIKSGKTYSDSATSSVDVSGGAQGGNGGQVEISAKEINGIHSQIDGHASEGWTGGKMLIDPQNITLSTTGTSTGTTTVLDPTTLDSMSQIILQATGNITLSTPWTVPDSSSATTLTLQAGNNIVFSSGDSLTVGRNWSVNLIAGADFNSTTSVKTGTGTILMSGNSSIQSVDGNIFVKAGNGITTGTGTIESTDGGSIQLQAVGQNISLGATAWNLQNGVTGSTVTLQAGGNITTTGGITAGPNWALDLVAGATFVTPTSVNTKGTGSVILNNSYLQTQDGDINVTAANSVIVGTQSGTTVTPGTGAIHTLGGGNINVNAVAGSVNAGNDTSSYLFQLGGIVSINLGGISTAAGGNVTINAGGNVTSFLPTGTSTSPTDAGTGAFGPEPGNVTITAGGNVYGHYVEADGTGTVTAQNGSAGSVNLVNNSPAYLALSLVTGSWVVNAPNGSINLQEVRNPNGALDGVGTGADAAQNNLFNYDPNDSVTLNAGNAVNLVGADLPRYSGHNVPCIYPPSLTINAGGGGVILGNNVTLFPSPNGELTINTTTTLPVGTPAPAPGSPPPGSFISQFINNSYFTLSMSDSGSTRWIGSGSAGSTDFANDHASTPVQLNNSQPVVLNIAGDIDNVSLITPKETQVTVGGNLNNINFTGQNLHPGDASFIHVAGNIIDQNSYTFVPLSSALPLPPAFYVGAIRNYLELLQNAVIPGTGPSSPGAGALFPTLDLFYLPATHQLGYSGVMTSDIEGAFLGILQEKTYTPGGTPILDAHGNYVTTPVTFAANSGATQSLYQAIQALFTASKNSATANSAAKGIIIGGPGQLDIAANSMDLGASIEGISSVGPAINNALAKIATTGAAIKIDLAGNLSMFASQISSWFGGNIDINSGGTIDAGLGDLPFQNPLAPHGIWTSGKSDVSVIAQGDINIDGSRIAAFDGGNVFVESLTGNVNTGTGSLSEILVNEIHVNPKTGAVTTPQQPIAGSGILATTLPDASPGLQVGNITVDTPEGNIVAGLGGITQEPENGNASLTPTVNLTAGTLGANGQVIHTGDIDAGNTGVIGININAQAAGKIKGLIISRGNANIHADTINATVLAVGTANLSANGSISGLAIGSSVNIGSGTFSGVALSQNVSGGGAVSALASTASASAGSQTSAGAEANSQKAETTGLTDTTTTDDELKNRGRALLAKYTGRVTVLLPPKQ